jgi:glutamate formiminotransferase / 5-formyltetrahydrofolate cyclo-ligase
VLVECVINISEGRDRSLVDRIGTAAGHTLLDTHSDPWHNRSVLTLGGEADNVASASQDIFRAACDLIDVSTHQGVHPRLGAVDVVPFVPLDGTLDKAVTIRNRFARWAGDQLRVPCFYYGPERSLPDVRRHAFRSIDPDAGPLTPHPTAGASAIGARPILVAYNVWITGPDTTPESALALACRIADTVRGPGIRALGLLVGDQAQVSCNLIDPLTVGPSQAFDTIARLVSKEHGTVVRSELVGLVPAAVLSATPRHRHVELDLAEDRTIEARLDSSDVLLRKR